MGGTMFEHGDWDAMAHVNFLRQNGGASAGYTANLIERLARSHRELYEALDETREYVADHAKISSRSQSFLELIDAALGRARGDQPDSDPPIPNSGIIGA